MAALARSLHEAGYAVLPGFASRAEVATLRRAAEQLVRSFDLALLPALTADNAELSAVCQNGAVRAASPAEYFQGSARSIRCFFEARAFDADGSLLCDRSAAVSKLGHALHDLDEAFRLFTRSRRVAEVFRSLSWPQPTPVQSMVMFKQPGFPNEVSAHQDSTYLFTDPLSTLGFWVALEDASASNGCLEVAAASHSAGVTRRLMLQAHGPATTFVGEAEEPPEEGYVQLPVEAGDAILFDGALWHRSGPNRSETARLAYTFHAVDGRAAYDAGNWLQPGDRPFEPLYVE